MILGSIRDIFSLLWGERPNNMCVSLQEESTLSFLLVTIKSMPESLQWVRVENLGQQ